MNFMLGTPTVATTSNRGFTPEELARQARNKIIAVSADADPAIRDQANAFGQQVERVMLQYLRQAAKSQRTTDAAKITQAGFPQLAKILMED